MSIPDLAPAVQRRRSDDRSSRGGLVITVASAVQVTIAAYFVVVGVLVFTRMNADPAGVVAGVFGDELPRFQRFGGPTSRLVITLNALLIVAVAAMMIVLAVRAARRSNSERIASGLLEIVFAVFALHTVLDARGGDVSVTPALLVLVGTVVAAVLYLTPAAAEACRAQPWPTQTAAVGIAVVAVVVVLLDRFARSGVFYETIIERRPGMSRGGPRWDWDYFYALIPPILRGAFITVRATVTGFLLAIVLGFLFALGRRSTHRIVRWPTALVIEFIRSTPLLIQLFFIYFTLPVWGISLSPLDALAIGLGIHYGTYASEAYRAGINSVPAGQWEASTALNLTTTTTWMRVILPQAIPNALPALGNNLVAALKDAPIGSAIQVTGILAAARSLSSGQSGVEEYMAVGIGFLSISIPAAWLVRRLERRMAYERIG